MTARPVCLLVIAKAPVPGFAKTRLCPPATPEQAAEIASASLLDTLDAVLATPGTLPVVAMTGEVRHAARSRELGALLRRVAVIPQRGDDFGQRLANAHADVRERHPGTPVLQIGMDTPQISPRLLGTAADGLRAGEQAMLGPAFDGGWWALGLGDPAHAVVLTSIPMSTSDTYRKTRSALKDVGLLISTLPPLSDVDMMAEARAVAHLAPFGRFARAVNALSTNRAAS